MRQSILRELALQSLQGTVDLEDHLRPELIQAAARENITLYEFIRERLLLKAGVSTVGALVALVERRAAADRFESETRGDGSPSRVAAWVARRVGDRLKGFGSAS
jgi:Asp-tRNA(Asn)/Glu-tRNA(Gln) amidotransferase B subunit